MITADLIYRKPARLFCVLVCLVSLFLMSSCEVPTGIADESMSVVSDHITQGESDMTVYDDDNYYVMAFFVQTGTWIEQYPIRFAYSNDCLNWTSLNEGEKIHSFCTRDPHIFRKDDNTFLIITTGGNGYLNIIESDDLCIFSAPRQIFVGPGGILDTWVGEIIKDSEDGQYIIHYTVKFPGRREHSLYFVKTSDFRSFSEPAVLIEEESVDIIDSCVFQHKEWFYLLFKNDDTDSTHIVKAFKATGPYDYSDSVIATEPYMDGHAEGTFIIHSAEGDRLFMYYDLFMNNGRWGLKTAPGDADDLTDPVVWTKMNAGTDYVLPKTKQGGPRHGNIIIVSREEFIKIMNKWG